MEPKFSYIDDNCHHLFIDESGDKNYEININSNTLFFSLSGLLVNGNILIKEFIPKCKKIKNKLYNDENIIFHFSDMLVAKNNFKKYEDELILKEDLEYIFENIRNIEFKIFLIHIDKQKMKNIYIKPADPYEISSTFLMERTSMFLCNSNINNKNIRVWFESRTKKDDQTLKKYMINEIKLPKDILFQRTNFPRYEYSIQNIRSFKWHFHSLPKDPKRLDLKYYKYEIGFDLIQILHITDLIVSIRRGYIENKTYKKFKNEKIKNINYILENTIYNKIEEKIFP